MNALLLLIAFAAQSDERLIQLLDHLDPEVRVHSAKTLGILRSTSAVEPLIEHVNDPELRVREAAAESLRLITGQNIGTDYEKWVRWWQQEGSIKFQPAVGSSQDLRRAVQPMIGELEAKLRETRTELEHKVEGGKDEIRVLSISVLIVGILFVLVMIFFVGNVSSKLKEWKEVAKQAEEYLGEGRQITKNTDRILEELEGKKLDIISFIGKLREENQSELDRYSDLLQQNTEHRMREEVMALRQKAEKELEQTLNERKGVIEHEIRQTVAGCREKLEKMFSEETERFQAHAEAHSLYLEASFYKANGKHEEALRLYRRMLEARPDHAVAWCEMGTVLHEMMRYDEAVDAYRKALELSPEESAVLYNLAATYAQQHKRGEMLEALRRAVQSDGEYKDEALNDPAFKAYWDDAGFKDLAES